MHELSIARALLAQCESAVIRAGRRPHELRSVRVRLGELAGVDGDPLRFAWDALCRTRGIEAVLDLRPRPAGLVCADCGPAERPEALGWLRICPRCGAPLRVEGGDGIVLESLELEDADPADDAAREPVLNAGDLR